MNGTWAKERRKRIANKKNRGAGTASEEVAIWKNKGKTTKTYTEMIQKEI